jgi:hypothetical protein
MKSAIFYAAFTWLPSQRSAPPFVRIDADEWIAAHFRFDSAGIAA